MRESKLVMNGVINFSFGKNGQGLTDEIRKIGEVIEMLGKDNHVYLTESFIDNTDDIYDLKFEVIPDSDNEWMLEENYGANKQPKDQI